MGQVPRAKPWLLLGDGRLALHLRTYLRQLGIPCGQWSRRRGWYEPPPQGGSPSLIAALSGYDRVLLAIADDALAEFVSSHASGECPIWVHFSGSRRIVGAWSAHPLCTFGPEPYEPAVYPTIPFVVESEGPGLCDLLPGLANPSIAIPVADKPLYHALCVAAGNFTTLLWQRFFAEVEQRWGITPELAAPYLRQTVANLQSSGRHRALTGPIARGDLETIGRNLEALEEARLGDLAGIYRAFVVSALPVAAETAA